MKKEEIIASLKDGLIVSCQAVPGEPHYMENITVKMAESAEWGGAVGIRANSPEDIEKIKRVVDLPIIGIWKIDRNIKDVYLTPNLDAAKKLWYAGAEIIAVQATKHKRDDGKYSYETIKEIKKEIPEALIFADIATPEDAVIAAENGADFVAPTLQGYTKAGYFDNVTIKDVPDFILLRDIVDAVKGTDTKVIMEGKVSTPEIAVQCLYMGAHAVVVGNAITRPHITAKRFARMLKRYHE
ncbi:N-acetylmannosamine-6-phosphate 2-epimerase [Enterococcus gallinarum]|uniref:N-acetylmannosamine-6-phosphate 2-epimerase n=1 Tax=Enterococcus gallinarum TaxID=1353 RepID=UPI00288E1393|nr:N-acetylmannosamine-6-phosphate 2-epimerase [Enterococcus gallinarum]MDT2730404.1 N-acetylmannosamine-6-phosphate 2-epimerase [Enterococcus gallinarum]